MIYIRENLWLLIDIFCIAIIDSHTSKEGTNEGGDAETQPGVEGGDGQGKSEDGDGTKTPQEGEAGQENGSQSDSNQSEGLSVDEGANATDTSLPSKKRSSWLPIIIIVAVIVAIILIGIIVFVALRKKPTGGYNQTATSEPGAGSGSKA